MHCRTAFSPIVNAEEPLRRRATALSGCCAVAALWSVLLAFGGARSLALYVVSSFTFLHLLSMHDAFQHTYTVALPSAPGDITENGF
jgi:hypothetical protein